MDTELRWALLQRLVTGVYGMLPISESTVSATDEYIAAARPPAALHRLLTEGRVEVLPALRCQACDRAAMRRPT